MSKVINPNREQNERHTTFTGFNYTPNLNYIDPELLDRARSMLDWRDDASEDSYFDSFAENDQLLARENMNKQPDTYSTTSTVQPDQDNRSIAETWTPNKDGFGRSNPAGLMVQAGAEASQGLAEGIFTNLNISAGGDVFNTYMSNVTGQNGIYSHMNERAMLEASAKSRGDQRAANWRTTAGKVAGPLGTIIGGIVENMTRQSYRSAEEAKIDYKITNTNRGDKIDPVDAPTALGVPKTVSRGHERGTDENTLKETPNRGNPVHYVNNSENVDIKGVSDTTSADDTQTEIK